MTLDKHAAELWARDGAHNESTFVYLSPEYQKLWFCKAYDEAAERDQIEKRLSMVQAQFHRIARALGYETVVEHKLIADLAIAAIESREKGGLKAASPPTAPPEKKAIHLVEKVEQICKDMNSVSQRWHELEAEDKHRIVETIHAENIHIEQLKRERAEARSALNRIHTAFSNGACGSFDPAAIAEKTVNFINAHKDAPEPPRKAVYEWQDAKDVPIHCYLFRGGACCGKVWPRGDGLCGWEASCTRALSQPIIGTAVTLQLARAAVEAVVRAHFGDEA